MRIALITDGIWPYVLGGMQKHSYYLCKYLAQNKINVDLIHFNKSNYNISLLEFFSDEEKKYIHSIIIDFPQGNKIPGHYIRSSYLHSKLIFDKIKNQLNNYDFIYTKGFTGWYLIEQKKAGKVKCCNIGVKFHGYEMFQKAPDLAAQLQYALLLRKPVKQISLNADVVFSYGGKITEIIKNIGVPENKIMVLPSGVESSVLAEQIKTTESVIKFLFLGRYERRKGIEELNIAIKKLRNRNFEFHFIGPIPEAKKSSDKRLIYHGEIRDKHQLNELIRKCDVMVCPSWSEGMPNVILEAMANGLAVIATNVGATNVLVNEKTGWLIEKSDPQLIADTLLKVIDSKSNEIDLKKQQALNHIKNDFVWEKLMLKFIGQIKAIS